MQCSEKKNQHYSHLGFVSELTNIPSFYVFGKYSWINDEKVNSKKANNVDIITPEEFTQEQMKVYDDFQGKASGFGMWVSQEDNAGTVLETADGYKPIIDGSPSDYKGSEAFGILAKDLGVDAVLIVANEVNSAKEGTMLKAVGMYMYGPNPVPKIEGQKYMGFIGAGRQEGNVYQLIKIKFAGDDGVPFYTINKKTKEASFNISGIEKIYSNLLGGIYYQLVTVNKCGQEKQVHSYSETLAFFKVQSLYHFFVCSLQDC